MSSVNTRLALGDAFAQIFDRLAELRPVAADIDAWRSAPGFERRRDRLAAQIGLDAMVAARALTARTPEAMFAELIALDDALRGVADPTPPPVAQRRAWRLRRFYEKHGRLNVNEDGAVLPRRVQAARPAAGSEGLADALLTLRIRKQTWSGVYHVVLRKEFDVYKRPGQRLSISSLPMLADPDDLSMTADTTAAGRAVYIASPQPFVADKVDIAAPLVHGVDLAIMPEVTLDPAGLSKWQESADIASATWIFAGTGPVSGDLPGASAPRSVAPTRSGNLLKPNRAALLHGPSGRTLAVQDKRLGFTIPPDMLADYRLGSAPAIAHDEGMLAGRMLTVIESRSGRFAIFVCEDLGRLPQLGGELLELGVSHVLVPILATPINRYRWQETAAAILATQLGLTTIVVNSIALGRITTGASGGDPAPTMMTVEPRDGTFDHDADLAANSKALTMSAAEDALTPRTGSVGAR